MSTAVMLEQTAGASPRLKARIAGALWLIIIVAASFAEFFVRGGIVVDGDAAATATNILAHEPLYRWGAAAVLIYLLCDTAVALILYELLKPVSRSLSLLASFFRLAMVAILGANLLNLFAPLVLLTGAPLSTSFKADQLQALALVSLKLYAQVFFIAMLFFGFHCLLIGYLIYRSKFPASNCGRAYGDRWVVLPDPRFRERPLTGIGGPSVHLPYAPRPPRGVIAYPMVPHDRRQRSTMERSGRRGGGMAIPTRHGRLINTVSPKLLYTGVQLLDTSGYY